MANTVAQCIELVEEAIEKSGRGVSGISADLIAISAESKTMFAGVESMDEPEYFHLLNNLTFPGSVVTHIGFWQGASLFSHLVGVAPRQVYAVDAFFNSQVLKETFLRNCSRLDLIGKYQLFDVDCFSVDLNRIVLPVDLHIYDADHTPEAQYKGIYYYGPTFNEVYMVVVDNFAYKGVADASDQAFIDLGHTVQKRWVVERHCHQGLYVVTKS